MVKLAIGPSRRLALALTLAHAGAAASVLSVEVPIWMKIVLPLAIAASLLHALNGAALLRSRAAIVAIEIGEGGAVSFKTRRGEWQEAALLDTSFVAPYLTVLNLQPKRSWFARHVVVAPDSVPAEDFRRLRVWLRWRKASAATGNSGPEGPLSS